MSRAKRQAQHYAASRFSTISSETKKTALVIMLFIYTVICGIIIADCGTSAIAGFSRALLVNKIIDIIRL
ncbi:MAG: hypothetical protein BWY15_00900 [Firmicutes bacterium ADurb.Bin193]|nr:MAG: hypothetical protein BWY15_00900 [Firmicutes bacterium ADurb.Bin193]